MNQPPMPRRRRCSRRPESSQLRHLSETGRRLRAGVLLFRLQRDGCRKSGGRAASAELPKARTCASSCFSSDRSAHPGSCFAASPLPCMHRKGAQPLCFSCSAFGPLRPFPGLCIPVEDEGEVPGRYAPNRDHKMVHCSYLYIPKPVCICILTWTCGPGTRQVRHETPGRGADQRDIPTSCQVRLP